MRHGFPGQSWLTFRQALGMGGNVRKGGRGTTVVFADRFIPGQERARTREQGDEPNAILFLKRFTVFNAAQCDGLPDASPDSLPMPCKGMVPVCMADLGCIFMIGVSVPASQVVVHMAWSPVNHQWPSVAIADGSVRSPDLRLPVRLV